MGGFSAIGPPPNGRLVRGFISPLSGVYCCLLCQLVIVNWFAFVSHCGLIIVRWSAGLCTLLLWARIISSLWSLKVDLGVFPSFSLYGGRLPANLAVVNLAGRGSQSLQQRPHLCSYIRRWLGSMSREKGVLTNGELMYDMYMYNTRIIVKFSFPPFLLHHYPLPF